ncbi:hypothetical protein DFH08DRAFT_299299 [Mycena albidolilacea]|uniref:DUF6534 domain-containing protein n=1 Tax=Mycena albidolilacea TaxID=1033008 RepID=A0AAD6ZQT8_9AGAR|nr:hypothetical protein DFH08DRAFT_299299 [Mycena albidolilacea]
MAIATTIDNTYGLLYIAVVVSSVLYGAGILQFWMYIRKYHSSDSIIVKSLVIAVLICDTIQQTLLCHSVYEYLVKSITDPTILPSVVNTLMIELFFSCAITTLVQQFYCWRIYKIGKSALLAAAVSLVSWSSCVTLIVYSINAVKLSLLSDVISLQKLSIASNTLSAVADITISVVLVVILHGAKTGFKQSTDLVNRLMVFTFNTGLPTSVCALVATICVAAFSETFLYIFFFLLLGRLYTNSILVTLNSREYIKSSSEGASQEQYSLENSRSGRARVPQMPTQNGITIRIDTNTMHDLDNGSAQDLKN